MRPLNHASLVDAVAIDMRGHRTPATLLLIDERDRIIREAARLHYIGMSDRQAAAMLRTALSRYRDGRWRRDCSEALCPVQHAGKLIAVLWMMLKVRDHVPSEPTIRRALAFRDPRHMLRSDV